MSIKCMSRIWETSNHQGSQLLLLLAIADHCNDDGICWPSVESLAKKSRMSKRQAQRIIDKLVTDRALYLERNTGRKHTNKYFLIVGLTKEQVSAVCQKYFSLTENEIEQLTNKNDILSPLEDKNSDNLTPFNNPKDDNLTPLKNKKGDILNERVTSRAKKGDIAMSPDPSCTRHENLHEEIGEQTSFVASPSQENFVPSQKNNIAIQTNIDSSEGETKTATVQETIEPAKPVKPKKATSKPKTPSDPRSSHPAIKAVRELIGRYPDKVTW